MPQIVYENGGAELLDEIAPLWEKLRRHHESVCTEFADELQRSTFAKRKAWIIARSQGGRLCVDLARSGERLVGYCVTAINSQPVGGIPSIYVEDEFRNARIGDTLMRRAMQWLDAAGAKQKIVEVIWGNDRAFSFYRRLGFFPRRIVFQQK